MRRREFFIGMCLLLAFAAWTVLVSVVDVQAIGPMGSEVGLAKLNGALHELIGVHMEIYVITDWLSLVPVLLGAWFAIVGLGQWIRRKNLLKVDRGILTLGGFYVIVGAVYIFFEKIGVNYRPVLINGLLEASYPSSTTVLVMCVMLTALMHFRNRGIRTAIVIFTALMVIGRLISGVHWFSDIVGGVLLSAGLVTVYHSIQEKTDL